MTERPVEDRRKIEDHLNVTKNLKEQENKLMRKFESLICNNTSKRDVPNISTQSSTDSDDDSSRGLHY